MSYPALPALFRKKGAVFFSALVSLAFGVEASAQDPVPKPGEVREIQITKDVKMKFCWIPAGEVQLGSPKAEIRHAKKALADLGIDEESEKYLRENIETQAEEKRGKFKTTGFWLGKYEVTQEQYELVMEEYPSEFNGKKRNAAKGMKTDRFPVEQVSWESTQKFIAKCSVKEGKLRLPHENEWEYACRGGKGNALPFYWGDSLNGTQANSSGKHPYGTDEEGPKLNRTTEVGSYEKVAPHPWGLCDMSGNVWEWCDNWYDERIRKNKVYRGGGFMLRSSVCRSASRDRTRPGQSDLENVGFRLLISTEKE